MVSYIKGGIQAKGIWKQDPEANIWIQEGWECGVERLHDAEPDSLYFSANIFRVIEYNRLSWSGHVARMEEDRSAFKMLTGKPILTVFFSLSLCFLKAFSPFALFCVFVIFYIKISMSALFITVYCKSLKILYFSWRTRTLKIS